MAKCKSCNADIIWIKTVNGKSMPCNAEPVTYWQNKQGKSTVVTRNGETYKADLTGDINKATGVGYIPHWVTCPQAQNFKRKQNT